MRAVWALPKPSRARRVRPFIGWGLLAASIALIATYGIAQRDTAATKAEDERVQFVLVAPEARKVAVVGDFNGWDAEHKAYQAEHRGGGVWSVTAKLPPGHHR